jgi:hypothetical protein
VNQATPHTHDFGYYSDNMTEERCVCGAIRVSIREHIQRCALWMEYYDQVKETPSAKLYQQMRQVFKSGDKEQVQDILAQSRELSHEVEVPVAKTIIAGQEVLVYERVRKLKNPLPMPHFRDPFNPRSRYIDSETGNALTPALAA